MMTVNDVLPYFNGKKVRLAEALKTTKQNVSHWGDGAIPELYELRLRHQILPKLISEGIGQKEIANHG